ncbi:MAG: outer membrane beta-barrel protein [Rikenellaceae bacterium]
MRKIALTIVTIIVATMNLEAQNTLGVTGGFGSGGESIYPVVEGRTLYGLSNFGITWRNYSKTDIVGCFGIDLEYMQRGFSFSPYASSVPEGETLYYYTRRINSIMLPIVWQPHVYMFDRRVRVFLEAAATFNYDLNSTYSNDYQRNIDESAGLESDDWEGVYEYMTSRDNRFGYGLAGGGGISLLGGKYEIMARIRYYYGFSDVVRNRNKYYSNNMDGSENPFILTPTRSPLNNLFINFGISYHFGPEGFLSWDEVKVKTPSMGKGFDYKGEVKDNNKNRR